MTTDDIRDTIAATKELLQSNRNSINNDILDALLSRLELRRIFLVATEGPDDLSDLDLARRPWNEGVAILPAIKSTHSFGKPVDEAFSVKLQRKLASTMPPRPIVQLEFDDALGHMSRLFRDGSELIKVLDYADSQSLQVTMVPDAAS